MQNDIKIHGYDCEATRAVDVRSGDLFGSVFNLLASIGGAPESMRGDFLFHHAQTATPCDEYRFQGHLGFGGKYRRKENRVTCYSEDETPQRLEIMRRLNAELAKLPNGKLTDESGRE